jgi:putative addiction module component (TIGR02574 family)
VRYFFVFSLNSGETTESTPEAVVQEAFCRIGPMAWNGRTDRFASNLRIRYNDGMSKVGRKDILNLSVAERIELIGDLWDSMAEVPDAIGLTDAQKAELDKRLDAHRKDPAAGAPWPVVRERIAKRK